MQRIAFFIVVASLAPAPLLYGHGTPIQVQAIGGELVVSGGLADPDGFALMIFLEDDADGDPFGTLTLPTLGSVIVWELPGLEIFGMNDASSLSIEVLVRPVKDSNPVEERLLWYWNPQTELVEPAAAPFYLLGTGMRFQTLAPTDTVAPPPFLLADPIAGHQGFHNHGLLKYALDNDPLPPTGVYGFFARLTSNEYAADDPFLVVFNHGVEYAQMNPAALAINAAAADPATGGLPGDYDNNGNIEPADYLVWRRNFGNTVTPFASADGSGNGAVDAADYIVWRGALASAAGAIRFDSVPEPRTCLAAGVTAVLLFSCQRKRCRRSSNS